MPPPIQPLRPLRLPMPLLPGPAPAPTRRKPSNEQGRFRSRTAIGSGRPMKSLYYRIRYGKPLVLVSGLPRSGTSMLMQMLEKGGMPIVTDQIRTPDEDNPKGYHEFERIKEIDKTTDKSWRKNYQGQVIKT